MAAATVSLSDSAPAGPAMDIMDIDSLRSQDDELSSETIDRLLKDAEQRLLQKRALQKKSKGPSAVNCKFPRLNTGQLPAPPIQAQGKVGVKAQPGVSVSEEDRRQADQMPTVPLPEVTQKRLNKEKKQQTAGAKWFDMPKTELTAEVKRDMDLIKLRTVLDPKRFYKKDKRKGYPEYSQMGTIIEGNTEFFSSRLARKERKNNIYEEVMADKAARQRFKSKYAESQRKFRSGKKEFYRKLQDMRAKKRK